MSRRDELLKYLGDKTDQAFVEQLVDEAVFLENQLDDLRKLPFIRVNPKDASQQKATPASKMYVSLMAQYNAIMRTLNHFAGGSEIEEDSPLRAWARANKE